MKYRKTYVDVVARIDVDGRMTPLSILWRDGRTFEIDRVHEAIRRASARVGGTGVRYLVSVRGREKYLFYEGPRWFVEEVVPEQSDEGGRDPAAVDGPASASAVRHAEALADAGGAGGDEASAGRMLKRLAQALSRRLGSVGPHSAPHPRA